jgi:hypothetical protein
MGRLLESGVAAGFGVADAFVQSKGGTLPGIGGRWPQGLYLELAGVAVGMFGGKVGVPADVRDPLFCVSVGFAAARATRYAMAGKLTQPATWAGMGGEGGDGDAGAGSVISLGTGGAGRPGQRLIGRGGGFGAGTGLYAGPLQEAAGTAG